MMSSSSSSSSTSWEALDREAEKLADESPNAEMPSLAHLTFRDYDRVYEPAEDTYLLLDAVRYIVTHRSIAHFPTVLEIGCGTGVASKAFHDLFPGPTMQFVTDLNEDALCIARATYGNNGLEAIRCDLVGALFQRNLDVVIFNPPYVPTPDEEIESGGALARSWAGGEDGRRVVDRAVPQIARLLKDTGIGLLVTVDENRPEDLAKLCQHHGLRMKPLFRRRAKNEYLTIQEITRSAKARK